MTSNTLRKLSKVSEFTVLDITLKNEIKSDSNVACISNIQGKNNLC